jgi:endonuclease/exonuclease/phosphatase family metal-dependent hydrolase
MRVLTWNLWWRHGPWQRRLDAITAALAEIDPDVCGLQEVWADPERDDNLAADLAKRLGMHWCWAGRPPNQSWQREHGSHLLAGNAVLSRWPIVEQAEISLPPTDDHPRLGLHALVDTPSGRLPFFTTHFSHQLGASAVRLAQARVLAGFIARHGVDHPWPPVVTGDLNAEPDSDELRLLGGILTPPAVPGLVLVDAWRYADPDQPATGHTWVRGNPYRADDPTPDARIDHILVGLPGTGYGRIRSARLAGNRPADGVWPSDHFAVVADLDP